MTIDEMIAVLQAAKEGKKIQAMVPSLGEWYDVKSPGWDFANFDYRVKREPREFRINYDPYPHVSGYEVGHVGSLGFLVREVLE